ncbi:MAG: TonB family protein [Nostocaceae cyanobacterium]|nr:TonB family protein [Nostocaceae cyanobacterium]
MGFSSIAAQARVKEAENLRSFITKSLIASVALHIGVLTLGIGNLLLTKIPQVDSEPIEVAIIAPPPQEKVKTVEAKVKKTTGGGGSGGSSSGSSSGGSSAGSTGQKSQIPQQSSIALRANKVRSQSSSNVVQKSVLEAALQRKPLNVKGIDNFQPQPITPIKPIEPVTTLFDVPPKQKIEKQKIEPQPPEISKTEVATTPKPIPTPSPSLQPKTEVATKPEPIPTPSPLSLPTSPPASSPPINTALTPPLDNDRLRKLLAEAENNASRPVNTNQASPGTSTGNFVTNNTPNTSASATGTGTGNGTGNGHASTNGTGTGAGSEANKIGTGTGSGTGSGRGSGHGSGTGSGTGSNTGNGYETKPQEEKKIATAPTPSKPPEINDTDLKLNTADCEECRITYPETAKRRGIEGNPEVAIDYDSQGRVTKVRLTRSSGSDELDNALLEQARDFKLKPTESGKQGVRVSGNYAIKRSRRHRELQAQKRQREEKRRQRQAEARQTEAEETKRKNPVSASPQTEENSPPLGTRETMTDVVPENQNRRTPAEKPGEIKAPRLRRHESKDAEEAPTPLPRQVESDNSIESEISPSPAGNNEETDRKEQKLREILGHPQQESDLLPAPSPTEPAQSEEKPSTSDGN